MGSWGTKLYQSDVADMVRDDYKNKLRAGKSDEETLKEMLLEYQYERADDEDKFDYWPALADTMWKIDTGSPGYLSENYSSHEGGYALGDAERSRKKRKRNAEIEGEVIVGYACKKKSKCT